MGIRVIGVSFFAGFAALLMLIPLQARLRDNMPAAVGTDETRNVGAVTGYDLRVDWRLCCLAHMRRWFEIVRCGLLPCLAVPCRAVRSGSVPSRAVRTGLVPFRPAACGPVRFRAVQRYEVPGRSVPLRAMPYRVARGVSWRCVPYGLVPCGLNT